MCKKDVLSVILNSNDFHIAKLKLKDKWFNFYALMDFELHCAMNVSSATKYIFSSQFYNTRIKRKFNARNIDSFYKQFKGDYSEFKRWVISVIMQKAYFSDKELREKLPELEIVFNYRKDYLDEMLSLAKDKMKTLKLSVKEFLDDDLKKNKVELKSTSDVAGFYPRRDELYESINALYNFFNAADSYLLFFYGTSFQRDIEKLNPLIPLFDSNPYPYQHYLLMLSRSVSLKAVNFDNERYSWGFSYEEIKKLVQALYEASNKIYKAITEHHKYVYRK